jgi:thymidylate synthase
MPKEDPWPSISSLMYAERELREGRDVDVAALKLNSYWSDIVRLLQVYHCFKNDKAAQIDGLKKLMTTRVYDPYIEKKKKTKPKPRAPVLLPGQLPLFGVQK